MRRIYSSCVSAAILYSTAWNGETAAVFANAEVVEGEHSVAFVAPEEEHVETAQREETDAAVRESEEKPDSPEEDEAERKKESATADAVSGAAPDSEGNEERIPEVAEMESENVVAAATEEANVESPETADATVASFTRMRDRARGRVNNPRRPTPSLSRPPHQADSASKKSSPKEAEPVPDPARNPPKTSDNTLTRLLNLILSLSGVDTHDPKHVQLTRDFNDLATDVLMRASNVRDDPNAPQTKENLVDLADAADMLVEMQLFPWQRELISFSFLQTMLEVFTAFIDALRELIQQILFQDPYSIVIETDVFKLLETFLGQWNRMLSIKVPESLIVAVREYEDLLQQVQSQATGTSADLTDGDVKNASNSVATAVSVVQKRDELMNLLSAFKSYALTAYSERIHAIDAAQGETSDVTSDGNQSKFIGGNLPEVIKALTDELEAVEKLKAVMVTVSEMCAASHNEREVPAFCKSMANAVGAGDDVKDMPRKLKEYRGDDDSVFSRVVDAFPMELQPQVDTVLARVPQLFPILAAATTNAVSAFVESSHEVMDWASSTAQEVLPVVPILP